MLKTYKIRSFKNGENKEGKPFMNYSITIPANIAEVLPEDVQFSVELTEEGLLFRRAEVSEGTVEVPSWAKSNGTSTAKPAAPKAKAAPAAKATGSTRKRPAAAKAEDKPAETAKATTRKRPATPKAKKAETTEQPKAKATAARKRPAASAKTAAKPAGRKRPGAAAKA